MSLQIQIQIQQLANSLMVARGCEDTKGGDAELASF